MVVNSVPASTSMVNEFNWAFPDRDKASDGTIGDAAHAASPSNHNPDETGNTGGNEDSDSINEVHARDVDRDLRRVGWSMERCVQIILARCRSGVERRLFEIIYNRRIWTAKYGWREREYTGSNPHDHHAHFSFRYGSGSGVSNPENITEPWGILAAMEEDDMPTLDEILDGIEDRIIPKIMTRLGAELAGATTAVRAGAVDAAYAGARNLFTDAHRAATGSPLYTELDPQSTEAKRMRFARDITAAVVKYAIDLDQAEEAAAEVPPTPLVIEDSAP